MLPASESGFIFLSRTGKGFGKSQEEGQGEKEMKWLKILLAIAEILIPGLAKAGKNKLADELEIAQGMLKTVTSGMTPEQKGRLLVEAVGSLKVAKKFKKRISNKLDKAQERWARKLL